MKMRIVNLLHMQTLFVLTAIFSVVESNGLTHCFADEPQQSFPTTTSIQDQTIEAVHRSIKEVFPDARVRVVPLINDAAVLVGTVKSSEENRIVIEIARVFYSTVIDNISLGPMKAKQPNVPSNELSNSQLPPVEPPAELRVTRDRSRDESNRDSRATDRLAKLEAPSREPVDSNSDQLKQLRDEVRALHDDVRRLSELIEKREAAKLDKDGAPKTVDSAVPLINNDEQNLSSPRPKAKFKGNQILCFTATWCGPCQQMSPIIKKLKSEGLPFFLVDIDKNRSLARQYHIDSIPCFVSLKDDEEIERIVGIVDVKKLRSLIVGSEGRVVRQETQDDGQSISRSKESLITISYSIADLVLPMSPTLQVDEQVTRNWLKLVDDITASIDADDWDINGGPCSICAFESTFALVIRAWPSSHDKVGEYLSRMRVAQDIQLSVAITPTFAFDEKLFKQDGLEFNFNPRSNIAELDEETAHRLINRLGSWTFNKTVTIFNGQIADVPCSVNLAEEPDYEISLRFRGIRLDDGRKIRLNFAANTQRVVSEMMSRSQIMPDRGYLVIDVTEQVQQTAQNTRIKGRMLVLVQVKNIVTKEESEGRTSKYDRRNLKSFFVGMTR